jgi:hypothetical protein
MCEKKQYNAGKWHLAGIRNQNVTNTKQDTNYSMIMFYEKL